MDLYIASNVVNFLAVVLILWKVGKQPARDFVKSRSENVKKFIHDAEGEYAVASAEESKWQQDWNAIESRVEKLQSDAETMVAQTRERVLADAKRQAERIESESKLLAQSELLRARNAVQKKVVEESLALAKGFMDKSLGKGERKKLVVDSLELVGNGHTS